MLTGKGVERSSPVISQKTALALPCGIPALQGLSLEERIDEGGNGGTLGEDDEKAKEHEEDEHGHHPPQFPRPEELQQLRRDAEAPQ